MSNKRLQQLHRLGDFDAEQRTVDFEGYLVDLVMRLEADFKIANQIIYESEQRIAELEAEVARLRGEVLI